MKYETQSLLWAYSAAQEKDMIKLRLLSDSGNIIRTLTREEWAGITGSLSRAGGLSQVLRMSKN